MGYSYTEENQQYIKDTSKNYFTMIPNIVFELGLSVYAVRLYCELKRVTGDYGGKCWINTEHLSERCQISTGNISAAKKELLEAGLILIENKGANHYHEITIVDIWDKNVQHFTPPSTGERPPSTGETKNNNIKNNKDHAREEYLQKIEDHKGQTKQSITKYEERTNKIPHLGEYPEDTWPVLEKFCSLWKISLPSRKAMDYGYWVRGARDLNIACEEHPGIVLDSIKEDLTTRKRGYEVTIASPNSLINMARAKVGELKIKAENADKPFVPLGAAELWVGGVKYER
jgi:hypothetical protein